MRKTIESRINWQLAAPLLVTILVAVSGYVYSHYSQLGNAQREAKLLRVNDQLRYLYGPLYSFSKITYKTWEDFRTHHRPDAERYWDAADPPDEKQKQAYRDYMTDVVAPYFSRVEIALLEYSDLIDEDEMPGVFLDLSAHIADYKSLHAAWARGDYSRHLPYDAYPKALDEYVRKKYMELKTRQMRLLGKRDPAGPPPEKKQQ